MKTFAYIGCRTTKERNARGKGITIYNWDTGSWNFLSQTENLINPSYQCFDHTGEFLYTVHGDFSEASSFRRHPETGALTHLNTVSTEGLNPVFIVPDKTNKYILVANLQTGNIVVSSREENGALGEMTDDISILGILPGSISHPHQLFWDCTQSWLFVPCQGRKSGISKICLFTFNSDAGKLKLHREIETTTLSEARHVAMHPNNRWLYLINEKASTITSYDFDAAAGNASELSTISSLPSGYDGPGQASGILVDTSGQFVFASNRKHDSVASFRINPDNGSLSPLCWQSTKGKTPRFITLSPDGKAVIAANEESDTIISFTIEADGTLTETIPMVDSPSPVCISFI